LVSAAKAGRNYMWFSLRLDSHTACGSWNQQVIAVFADLTLVRLGKT